MCGIAGYAGLRDPELLDRMVRVQTHRGPDDRGVYLHGDIGLGMRRLSIIDLAGGHQPIANEDGTVWIVYNGEIYNHAAIADELKALGHRFTTRSDTEMVVHAYEAWGDACVERFNGMFAFAIHDQRRERVLLARDRIGIKPLYYALIDGRLLFASELKALLESPLVSREPDPSAIHRYLMV